MGLPAEQCQPDSDVAFVRMVNGLPDLKTGPSTASNVSKCDFELVPLRVPTPEVQDIFADSDDDEIWNNSMCQQPNESPDAAKECAETTIIAPDVVHAIEDKSLSHIRANPEEEYFRLVSDGSC